MRIAVELPWDASAHMGTGVYSESMVRALARAAPQASVLLIVPPQVPHGIELKNVSYHSPEVIGLRGDGYRQVAVPALVERLKADVLFAPATLLPVARVCPTVATVHDLTFIEHPEYYGQGLIEFLKQVFEPSLRAADHVVAISRETRAALERLSGVAPAKITVIHQPVREQFQVRMPADAVRARLQALGIQTPYYFHVSNLSPHKNVAFVIRAFQAFCAQDRTRTHRLVIAGGGMAPNQPPDFIKLAHEHGVADRLLFLGRVETATLQALFQGCDALLFPSLAEGWGLPVAEAQVLGVRAFASPFVPAAGQEQRLTLDVERWVQAMADSDAGVFTGTNVESPEAIGKQLLQVLKNAAARVHVTGIEPILRSTLLSAPNDYGVSGCTIVRNAVRLRYPLVESIASFAPLCDEIVICWDPTSDDGTDRALQAIAKRWPKVRLVESVWDMARRSGGGELARQTQIAFSHCRCPWTLYIQADEALHERDHEALRMLASDPGLSGLTFQRRSFFHSLDQEISEHFSPNLLRMFRTGHGRSLGDAMHCAVENHPGRIVTTAATLFNYSRMGDDDEITLRSDNLNRFYRTDEELRSLDPDRNKHWKTRPFGDSHPAPIEARFRRAGSARSALKVLITVDDIRPAAGYGLELDSGCIAHLRALNAEFQCRFTLFMPTHYHGQFDLRDHADWFRALQQTGCFEVAVHGHHHWNLGDGKGEMEYLFESTDEAHWNIQRSLEIFHALGCRPRGAKPPGWGYTPVAVPAFTSAFTYLADHIIGTDWDLQLPGLPRLPYTRCIHEPMDDLLTTEGPLVVLHSHISSENGKHDNGWSIENVSRVRQFLRRLTDSGRPLEFTTPSECLPQPVAVR